MARARKHDTTSETTCETPADDALPAIAKPSTDMTFLERVEQTIVWLLTGARESDVIEAIREMWPDQDIEPLTTAAINQLIESADVDPAAVRGWCFEATKHLYQKMVAIGDFAGALRAVKQLHEMVGR